MSINTEEWKAQQEKWKRKFHEKYCPDEVPDNIRLMIDKEMNGRQYEMTKITLDINPSPGTKIWQARTIEEKPYYYTVIVPGPNDLVHYPESQLKGRVFRDSDESVKDFY